MNGKKPAAPESDNEDGDESGDDSFDDEGGDSAGEEDAESQEFSVDGFDEDDASDEGADGEDGDASGDDADEAGGDDNDDDDGDDGLDILDLFDANAEQESKAKAKAKAQQQRKRGASDAGSDSAPARKRGKMAAPSESEEDDDDDVEEGSDDDEDGEAGLTAAQEAALDSLLAKLGAGAEGDDGGAGDAASGGPKAKRARTRGPLAPALPELAAPSGPEGEYGLGGQRGGKGGKKRAAAHAASSGAGDDDGGLGVDLSSLVGGLAGDAHYGDLKKKLAGLVGSATAAAAGGAAGKGRRAQAAAAAATTSAGVLVVPPPKSLTDRAERELAYRETSRDISKWVPLMQMNRSAPHLSFAAEAAADAPRVAPSTSALAEGFTPANEFEAAIAGALSASGMGAMPGQLVAGGGRAKRGDAAVLAAESADLPTAPLDPAAMRARQGALAKMRALMFYDEQKARRANKIKSKAYRKLKGRADMRRGEREMDELAEANPSASAALAEEEARRMAKERMTLKLRAGKGIGGSKWIKRVLGRAGGVGAQDAATKDALVSHMKRAEELKARMRALAEERGAEDSDDEDDDFDEGEEGDAPLGAEGDASVLAGARRRILASAGLREGEEGEEGEGSGSEGEAGGPEAKGLFGMRFMRNAATRARSGAKAEARALAAELAADEARLRAAVARPGSGFEGVSFSDDEEEGDGDDDSDSDGDGGHSDGEGAGAVAGTADAARDAAAPALKAASKAAKKAAAAAAAAAASAPAVPGRRAYGGVDGKRGVSGAAGAGLDAEGQAAVAAALAGTTRAGGASVAVGGPIAVEGAASRAHPGGSNDDNDSDDDSDVGAGAAVAASSSGGNPWLSQGGVAYAGQGNAPRGDGDAGGASSNPWLTANAYNSSAAAGAGDATGVNVTRSKATKRAREAAAGTGASGPVLIDVAGSLARLEGASQGQGQARDRRTIDTSEGGERGGAPGGAPSAGAPAVKDGKQGGKKRAPGPTSSAHSAGASLALAQAELIRRAFGGFSASTQADEVAELGAEKESEAAAMAEEDAKVSKSLQKKGTADPTGLAGWGAWAGMGAPSAEEQAKAETARLASRRRRPSGVAAAAAAVATAKPTAPQGALGTRADGKLATVLLSERRDRKMARSHQADTVPLPFASREQYERAMAAPVGRDWNAVGTTAALTLPEWTSKAGVIIAPIKFAAVKRGDAHKEEARGASNAASLGGIRKRKER